jgi:DNA invertase Pin-like site-specific DNA recombinase
MLVLPGVAEFERELIKIRTSEGPGLAKKNGVRMGGNPCSRPTRLLRSVSARLTRIRSAVDRIGSVQTRSPVR